MISFNVFFEDLDHISRRAICQKSFIVKQLSVTISVFRVSCDVKSPLIETSNQAVLFNIFIFLHPTLTNVITSWRRLIRSVMLRSTGMGTPLSCDYDVTRFLCIFNHT